VDDHDRIHLSLRRGIEIATNEFMCKIKWVQIDIDAAAKDAHHMIVAEERFNLAMGWP
jgi:hypothetical protein